MANEGKGLPSSLKEGCRSTAAQEVNTTLTPVWIVGSRMTVPVDDQGGVHVGASPELAKVCSAVRGLFLVRLVGGGGRGV